MDVTMNVNGKYTSNNLQGSARLKNDSSDNTIQNSDKEVLRLCK